MILQRSATPDQGGTPPRAHVLPLGPADASSGPRHAAVLWINAVGRGDHRAALKLARELRARWRISICLAPEPKGGGL